MKQIEAVEAINAVLWHLLWQIEKPSSPYEIRLWRLLKTLACDTFCDKQLENDVEVTFSEIRKTLNPLWIKRFLMSGISRTRTYDLHDVNGCLKSLCDNKNQHFAWSTINEKINNKHVRGSCMRRHGQSKTTEAFGLSVVLLSVDTSVRSVACEVVKGNVVVVCKLYQMFKRNSLETAFVSGVERSLRLFVSIDCFACGIC